MGSAVGSYKAAAKRVGLGENEYLDRLNKGLLYCTRCADWHPAEEFALDRSRMRGRTSSCRKSRNAAAKRNYERRQRPAPGRRFTPPRDGDKLQARRRVNHLIDVGLLPRPDDVKCADCGHLGSDRRHEYDHHLGYAAEHHEHVEAVCAPCHHAREDARRADEN